MYGNRPSYYGDYVNLYNRVYPYPYPVYGHYERQQYPDVDPAKFKESAEAFHILILEANSLFKALADSPDLAGHIMDAAQKNDREKVKQLIASAGISENVEVNYTPDSFKLEMISKVEGTECCRLSMTLRW
ncbi:hypothetical protein ACLIA0_12860 [Bacillaceae bacterium W0354]